MPENDLTTQLLPSNNSERVAEVIVDIESNGQYREEENEERGRRERETTTIEDENPFDFLQAKHFTVPSPTPLNPFRNQTPNIEGFYEWLKIIICIPIALCRLVVFGLSLAVGYIVTKFALYGWKDKQSPMPRWRCRVLWLTRMCTRCILFSFGYHWIRRKGRPVKRETAPIVVSNHVSQLAALFLLS
ncbi:hypothetical protein AQUCO_05200038v1 [Aquilegia coerulea]|uniref:Phospholipid/glycerol acyltransferase domain-containing protein n=1 Tax=Aquilegia coerulea TaxID=218851 RepID=A0A2G5CJ04_AQUCA|nr:hypothetical protein AQUCO_05200038v1 [Aquilegia coerulea]